MAHQNSSMVQTRLTLTPFWLVLWSLALAAGWLLPNHYRPWLSFHTDAWISLVAAVAAATVIFRSRTPMACHGITVLIGLLLCAPWAQYFFGIIHFAGDAWISSVYLLALLLSILIGTQWEADSPCQLADGLFFAIGIAAVISVGLQLMQWLQLNPESMELWTMGGGSGRPHANIGQPNQLGTLLLWGLLATAWGQIRKHIGAWTAMLLSTYLLFGLALTGSRTAWLAVILTLIAIWIWHRIWLSPKTPWIATGMAAYFFMCVVALKFFQVNKALPSPSTLDVVTLTSKEDRLSAWTVFIDAAWQQPFLGYGWNQGVSAQLKTATNHTNLGGIFRYSHNLFLDLILWCGIPLGILLSLFLLWWFWKRFCAIRCSEDAVLMLFLLVVANHAMLELPLHYAYLLLPTGMVIGIINKRLDIRPIFLLKRHIPTILLLASTTLLIVLIRDYSKIEDSHRTLRMEWDGFKPSVPHPPPNLFILTQWRDYFQYARYEPANGLSTEELDHMRNIVSLFPNVVFLHKYVTILALNHRPDEAQSWIKVMKKTIPEDQYRSAKKTWKKQAQEHSEIAAIPWPL